MITQIHYDKNMEPIIISDENEIVCSEESREGIVEEKDFTVSIIVLCWNNLKYTKICIESIKRHTKLPYQLIAVDQGSNDGTLEFIEEALTGDLDRIIRNRTNKGFSCGNNQALKLAECRYVLMLNNDCEVQADNWLELMIDAEKTAGLIGAVCRKVNPNHDTKSFDFIGCGKEEELWSYIEGWCLFAKRDVWLAFDGFDEQFNPAYSEDSDLSFRMKSRGIKIKAVDIPVKHFGNKSMEKDRDKFGLLAGKNNQLLYNKWILEPNTGFIPEYRLKPEREAFSLECKSMLIHKMELKEALNLFKGKKGIEIGGPSRIFDDKDGYLPLYPLVEMLDGCNFSEKTLWKSGLKEGETYAFFEGKLGLQYICEATEIDNKIPLGKYEFVISSNCLEHVANPLKAIVAFKRITRIGGLILLVLPNKEVTFDHKRSTTSYMHLYKDYLNNIGENDLTHLDEILSLHDLSRDPPAGNMEEFKQRSKDNFHNRGLHHHVFDSSLIDDICMAMNIKVLFLDCIGSDYVMIGRV